MSAQDIDAIQPLISVIVPCFNQAHYLPDAIASLVAQTLLEWECIIVDDGSPDNTREVSQMLAAGDPRIRPFSQVNKGLSGARNAGLNLARGQYIQFLDADDFLAPEKFARQVAALESVDREGVAICDYAYCDASDPSNELSNMYVRPWLDPDRALEEIILRWESGLCIPAHAFLFSKALFSQNGITFNTALPTHEDWECWVRIMAKHPKVVLVDQKLATYRFNWQSMSQNRPKMREGFLLAIKHLQRIFADSPDTCALLNAKRTKVRRAYRWSHPFWHGVKQLVPKTTIPYIRRVLQKA